MDGNTENREGFDLNQRPNRVNKSQLIRDYLAAHAEATDSEIATALAQYGVSRNLVAVVRNNLRSRSQPKKRRERHRVASDEHGNGIDHLVVAKQFADRVGGIDEARKALTLLSRILG